MKDRPLASFCVATYNQERFVADAVESALSQTYSPLEILFSDDCSSDGTFDVIQERVARYSGPHRIVLNRNPHNLGIGAHWNRVVRLAHGAVIVHAAGDDISHPERTEELVRILTETHPPVFACLSHFRDFEGDPGPFPDETDRGSELEIYRFPAVLRRGGGLMAGAAYAYRREVFERFGPLPEDKQFCTEDRVLPLRAALLGGVALYRRTLLLRRLHEENLSVPAGNDPRNHARATFRLVHSLGLGLETVSADLDRAAEDGLLARADHAEAKTLLSRLDAARRARLACQHPSLLVRWGGCLRLALLSPWLPHADRLRILRRTVVRALNGQGVVDRLPA